MNMRQGEDIKKTQKELLEMTNTRSEMKNKLHFILLSLLD